MAAVSLHWLAQGLPWSSVPSSNLPMPTHQRVQPATPPILLRHVYDRALSLVCAYAWRCPKKTELVPFFDVNSSPPDASSPRRHLDIGVGTGFFLESAPFHNVSHIALSDLNPDCLEAAAARARRAHPSLSCETVQADFLAPDALSADKFDNTKFDAVSVMLLLHCLPGPPPPKATALVRLKHLLAEDGVLFGATVLGSGVKHNLFGRLILWWFNRKGFFGNSDDEAASFVEPLEEAFTSVNWGVVGTVLLFHARGPKL